MHYYYYQAGQFWPEQQQVQPCCEHSMSSEGDNFSIQQKYSDFSSIFYVYWGCSNMLHFSPVVRQVSDTHNISDKKGLKKSKDSHFLSTPRCYGSERAQPLWVNIGFIPYFKCQIKPCVKPKYPKLGSLCGPKPYSSCHQHMNISTNTCTIWEPDGVDQSDIS